jgi:hypothetical protein
MIVDNWEDISIETLEDAVEEGYPEGKELEFKRELNPENSGHKAKLLGEVTSFANSGGGDLVVGIVDEEGIATGLWPVQYDDIDTTVDRWVNIIKRNTDPEIPQHLLEIQPISVEGEQGEYVDENCPAPTGHILVIRVRRSWRAPHRETVNNRFYERSASGNSELDTGAIRRAMLQGEVFVERAKEFRDNRISAIAADELPFPLRELPKIVVHLMPSNCFGVEPLIDPQTANPWNTAEGGIAPELLSPNRSRGNWERFTEEGYFLATRQSQYENRISKYTLTFRLGTIEAVTTGPAILHSEPNYISTPNLRNCFEQVLEDYWRFIEDAGGAYPFHLFVSIVGAKGLPACTEDQVRWPDELKLIDREIVRVPVVVINSPSEDIEEHIDEILDRIANASGFAEDHS